MPDTSFDQLPAASPLEESRIIARADELVAVGNFRAAIDYVNDAIGSMRSAELDRRLVSLRASAFPSLDRSKSRAPWPEQYKDPFPGLRGLPEIDAADLTVDVMAGAFQHHGSLWVHGLVSPEETEHLRRGIERAFAARDAHYAGAAAEETNPWYSQIPLDNAVGMARGWVEGGGGVWTADSPRMMYELIEFFIRKGVVDKIGDYLGEHPALSVGKSTLRCVPCTSSTDWHQDGAFLGADVRTVNVWIALSDCGEDAPGLDIVGQRLNYIVPPGTHGAAFDWSVGPGAVDLLAETGAPMVSPAFKAGDAMFFDQMMLHRTGVRPGMTKSRFAIESWFFAPSTYPIEQGPLVV